MLSLHKSMVFAGFKDISITYSHRELEALNTFSSFESPPSEIREIKIMVMTAIDFQHALFTKALARTKAGVNLWEVKVKQGQLPACKEFRSAIAAIELICGIHPHVAKARSQELTEQLDYIFAEVFEAFTEGMGSLHAIAILK